MITDALNILKLTRIFEGKGRDFFRFIENSHSFTLNELTLLAQELVDDAQKYQLNLMALPIDSLRVIARIGLMERLGHFSEEDSLAAFDFLIDRIIFSDRLDLSRNTALHMAVNSLGLTKRLVLDHQHPVDCRNLPSYSPMLIAAQQGQVEVVQFLIEHGANPLQQSFNKESALYKAAYYSCFPLAHYLVQNHPDLLNLLDLHGKSPDEVAQAQEHHEMALYLKSARTAYLEQQALEGLIETPISHGAKARPFKSAL